MFCIDIHWFFPLSPPLCCELIFWGFYLFFAFFSFKISVWFFYTSSISLLTLFFQLCQMCMSVFVEVVLISIDCFPFQVESLLVLHIMNDFFDRNIYIMCIMLWYSKSYLNLCFSCLSLTVLWQEREHCLLIARCGY